MNFTDDEKKVLKQILNQHLKQLKGVENSGYEDGGEIVAEKDYEFFIKGILAKLS